MSTPLPDLSAGIAYWNTQPATYDGVLGGYGTGSLPRVDALGSRLFLLKLLPELSTVPSALKPLAPQPKPYRYRALDVGAGVGRVTADVLLHLVSDVLLLEPVTPFIDEALNCARSSVASPDLPADKTWKGLADHSKSVTFVQGPLQTFDPKHPLTGEGMMLRDRIGRQGTDIATGFDVAWCQWCLGHLNHDELVAFFIRCRNALRQPGRSLIVVKENVCSDGLDGAARQSFDEEDSSLTRSDMMWKKIFKETGLQLIREQVQEGLPEGLFTVKMYALR